MGPVPVVGHVDGCAPAGQRPADGATEVDAAAMPGPPAASETGCEPASQRPHRIAYLIELVPGGAEELDVLHRGVRQPLVGTAELVAHLSCHEALEVLNPLPQLGGGHIGIGLAGIAHDPGEVSRL